MAEMTAKARDVALRAIAEGAAPSFDLLADVSGLTLEQVQLMARRGKWALGAAGRQDLLERIQAVTGQLLDRVEAMGRAALENGGRIDKAEIDGIVALARSLEKIGDIMRPQEAAAKTRQDEELADALGIINDRIVALATELAERIAGENARLPGGAAGAS